MILAAPIKSGTSSSILSRINRTQQLLFVTLGMGILTLAIGVVMIQVPWQERRRQLTSRYGEEKERSDLLQVIQALLVGAAHALCFGRSDQEQSHHHGNHHGKRYQAGEQLRGVEFYVHTFFSSLRRSIR